jgi:hypothetical protein
VEQELADGRDPHAPESREEWAPDQSRSRQRQPERIGTLAGCSIRGAWTARGRVG